MSSSRPFISFDAPDGLGIRAQVSVKRVTGAVDRIEEGGGQAVKIVFDHKAMGLAKPVYGWTTVGSPVHQAAQAVAGTGRAVTARCETSRKVGQDRTRPLFAAGKLAFEPEETRNLCVAIGDACSDEALTDPAEDAQWEGIGRGDVPDFLEAGSTVEQSTGPTKDQLLKLLATARAQSVGDDVVAALAAQALILGASPQEIRDPRRSKPQGFPSSRSHEALPWDSRNSDGRPNIGCYEVAAVLKLNRILGDIVRDAQPDTGAQERRVITDKLTAYMAEIVDEIQTGAYGSGRRDRMARSWQVALSTMFDHLKEAPLPFGADDAGRAQWRTNLVTNSVQSIRDVVEFIYQDGNFDSNPAPAQPTSPTPDAPPPGDRAVEPPPAEDTPESAAASMASDAADNQLPPAGQPAAAVHTTSTAQSDAEFATAPAETEVDALVGCIAELIAESGLSAGPGGPWGKLIWHQFKVRTTREMPFDHLKAAVDHFSGKPREFGDWVTARVAEIPAAA